MKLHLKWIPKGVFVSLEFPGGRAFEWEEWKKNLPQIKRAFKNEI
jgi:hypothetical protein